MELTFKKLEMADAIALKPYFAACRFYISDYSAAFKVMWQKHFVLEYAFVEGCLVFKEKYSGRVYFHYPMSMGDQEAESRALDSIETYCRERNIRIHYTNVPKACVMPLIERYGMDVRVINHRRWRDYLYNAQDFVLYPGKKFSGQRNHVNKFKRLYPDYKFRALSGADGQEIIAFLKRFEARQLAKGTAMAKDELEGVYELLPYVDELGLKLGALEVGGSIVAISMGERCGDQLIVHVEKALTDYDGVYPTMANEFAKHYVDEGVRYINREDDAGDAGLRKSKLQYNPVCMVDKYDLLPRRIIDRMTAMPVIHTERLIVREITDMFMLDFYRLEYDAERNKYWGYNWREHLTEEPTPDTFMQGIREDFKKREEVPLGIFLGKTLVGEVVLHNFGYRNDCEIGVRLLPEFEGKGYAREALVGTMNYAFYELNVETVLAKCYKQNGRSKNTLLAAGLRQTGEDETYFHFKKTAAM